MTSNPITKSVNNITGFADKVVRVRPVFRGRWRLAFRLRFAVRNRLLVERLASTGRLTLLVRNFERVWSGGRVRLRDRVREPVVWGKRWIGTDSGAPVASSALLGLVGVGRFGDVPEPPESNWDNEYLRLECATRAISGVNAPGYRAYPYLVG